MKDYVQVAKEIANDNETSFKYGLYNVSISLSKSCFSGFTWIYRYFDNVANKLKTISSTNLLELRKKVEDKGLEWCVTDVNDAQKAYALNNEILDVRSIQNVKKHTKRGKYKIDNDSGVRYVYQSKNKNKWYWFYGTRFVNKDGEDEFVHISCRTLSGLKEKVLNKGYEWDIIDREKYEKSLLIQFDD